MSDKLYIIIPAYNEEENIETVVREWHEIAVKTGPESKLVVINDGSVDNTYSKLCELAQELGQLEPMTKLNSGHGATILRGYRYALDEGADYVFQTDSDGQTIANEFFTLWEKREQYDALIGKRSHREDGASRVFVSKVLKMVLMVIFGVNVPDANTPFRLLNRRSLEMYLPLVPEDFFLSNVMLTVLLAKGQKKNEVKIDFPPITFRPRQGGVNSINLGKIFKIGIKAAKDFYVIKKSL